MESIQFFENLVGEVLGLVDDDDDEAVLGKLLDKELVQGHEHRGLVGLGVDLDGELIADQANKLGTVQVRIANQGDLGVVFEVLEQQVGHQRLARPDFAGKQHEAAALFDGINQVCERLVVPGRLVEEARIRCVPEG